MVSSFACHRKAGSLVNAGVLKTFFGCNDDEARKALVYGAADGTFKVVDGKAGVFVLLSDSEQTEAKAILASGAKFLADEIAKKAGMIQ